MKDEIEAEPWHIKDTAAIKGNTKESRPHKRWVVLRVLLLQTKINLRGDKLPPVPPAQNDQESGNEIIEHDHIETVSFPA
jgi:hypothetical protein